jgi:hypothetical protein
VEAKELLKKIAKSLSKECIEYMVVGGQAVLIYREPNSQDFCWKRKRFRRCKKDNFEK